MMSDIIAITESLSLNENDFQKKYEELCNAVNQLIIDNPEKLYRILYRIDVREKDLKKALSENPKTDAAKIISTLLLERQLEKIKTRAAFKQNPDNISEEEKW